MKNIYKNILLALLILAGSMVTSISAKAQFTFTDTIYSEKDAVVTTDDPTGNYGNSPTFRCLLMNGGKPVNERSFIKFAIPNIPSDVEIISANIYLFGINHKGKNESLLQMVGEDWGEYTVNYKNQPKLVDISQTLPQSHSSTENYVVNALEFSRKWINGQMPNYGLALRIGGVGLENENGLSFGSRDYTDPAKRPYIVITYYMKSIPLTALISEQCNAESLNFNALLKAEPVYKAQAYKFKVKEVETGIVDSLIKTQSSLYLTELFPFHPGNTYEIQVCAQIEGHWGEYGSICIVKTNKSLVLQTCIEETISRPLAGLNTTVNDTLIINFPSGVVPTNTATVNGLPVGSITFPSSQSAQYIFNTSNPNPLLSYNVVIGCEQFSASTHQLLDSLTLFDNGSAIILHDTFRVSSPWIIFKNNPNQNINFTNAFVHVPFTRTYVYKNTGVPYTGSFKFVDSIPNFNNSAVRIVSIDDITVSSGTVSIINQSIKDSITHQLLSISNLGVGDSITITESVELIGCPGLQDNKTYFSANYGCSSGQLCVSAETNVLWTTTTEDPNDKPIIQYELLTPGYPTCWNDMKERIIKIKNIGLGSADSISVAINRYWYPTNYHISENIMDSVLIYKDPSNPYNVMNYAAPDTLDPGYFYHVLEPLAAGDSMYIRYYETVHCIDSSRYESLFNNTIYMHYEGFPWVRLFHPCKTTDLSAYDPTEYGWKAWEHTSQLEQTFNNYVGTMSGGDESDFDVSCANLVVAGLFGSNIVDVWGQSSNGFIFNLDSSEIIIELKLDSGLGLVHDSLYMYSNVAGSILKIKADTIEYLLGLNPIVGGGDRIIAHFSIPDTFYYSLPQFPQPYAHGLLDRSTAYYNEFFSKFKVRFRLHAYCEYMMPEPSKLVEKFFFVPNKYCNPDCKLPLAKVQDQINIHCPGCLFPGWNMQTFDMKRINYGYADNNNNNFPDSYPMLPADINLIKIKNAMVGDTIACKITGFISDGEDSLKFSTIGFDFKYAQFLITNSRFGHLRFIGATGTYYDANGAHNFQVNSSSGHQPDSSSFYIDLSIDSLKTFCSDPTLTRFWLGDSITLFPRFVIAKNMINPYFNIEANSVFLIMSGTPFTGVMTKPDALNFTPDSITSMSYAERSQLAYWCTGNEGRYGAVGADFAFGANFPTVSHEGYTTENYHPCKNILRFEAATEVGHSILSEYDNDQAAWNSFSFELRNLWMLDSIQINFPAGYTLDSVIFANTQITSNGTGGNSYYTCNHWYQNSWHDYDLNDAIIGSTSATIYPARNLANIFNDLCTGPNDTNLIGYDESKRYRIFFVLKSIICGPPYSYNTVGNYPIVSYWSNFPTALTGDTTIIQPIASGEFNKPDATLHTTLDLLTQDAPNSDLVMDFTINTNPNYLPPSRTHMISENTFFIVNSPTGNVTVQGIYNTITNHWVHGVSKIGNDSVYAVGMVGDAWGAAKLKVYADYNCANIDSTDSLHIFYGWNCGGYPGSLMPLDSVCYVDSQWVKFRIIKPGLIATIDTLQSAGMCDTLRYGVTLQATGSGNVNNVNVTLYTGSGVYDYLSGSALASFNGNSMPITMIPIPPDSMSFSLPDSILVTDFAEGDTMRFMFSIVPNCGFYQSTEEITLSITAENYCGNPIGPIVVGDRPDVINGLPLQDSLTVEVIGDTVSGCGDAAIIQLNITNNGINNTGSLNTVTIALPSGFAWNSGDSFINQTGQLYTFAINGGIANGGIQNIQFTTSGSAAAGLYDLTASIWVKQQVFCGVDTCEFIQAFAEDLDSAILAVIPVNVVASNDTAICIGATATLNATGATTYVWSNGGSTSTITVAPTSTTTFTVTGTDTNGCSNTDEVVVSVNSLPSVTIAGDTLICSGDIDTLVANGAANYIWSNGLTTTTIYVHPIVTTTYTVTGTNVYGCSSTAQIVVHVNPALNVTASITNGNSFLPGDTVNYQIVVCNTGFTTANSISIWDTIPGGVFSSVLTSDFTQSGLVLSASINSLAPGMCDTLEFSGIINSTLDILCSTYQTENCVTIISASGSCGVAEDCVSFGFNIISVPPNATSISYPSFINQYVDMQGDFIVVMGSTCNMYLSKIRMHAGHKIIIEGLNISGYYGQLDMALTHLFSCDTMWYGIDVKKDGLLNANKQNIIEDAHYAINLVGGSKAISHGNIFRQNYVGVNVSGNASLTCSIGSNEFIGNQILQTHFVGQTPVPLPHPYAGMQIKNCTWGSGVIAGNLFRELSNGILAQRCYLAINGNKFRNIRPYNDSPYNVYGNSSMTNYNGTALFIRGAGSPGSLVYNGSGMNLTDTAVFRNCHYAVAADKANCQVNKSRMTQVDYGVSTVAFGDGSINTQVWSNRIEAYYYGVRYWQAKGNITANNISMYGSYSNGRGISITGNYTTSVKSTVYGNDIYLYQGIRGIELLNDTRSKVLWNNIAINHANTSYGIYVANGNYPTSPTDSINNIRYNSVIGGTVSNINQRAIGINATNYAGVVCNTVNNTGTGVHFFMANPGTNFAGNIMQNHYNGLYISIGSYCGLQYQKGNKWIGSCITEARNDEFNYIPSRFRVHDNNPTHNWWPSPLYPTTGWFQALNGTPYVCHDVPPDFLSNIVTELDTTIATDSINLFYLEQVKGSSEKYLYHKLDANPNVIPTDTTQIISKFYSKKNQKISGRFAKVEKSIEEIMTIQLYNDAETLRNTASNYLTSICRNDSLLQNHPPDSLLLISQNTAYMRQIAITDSLIAIKDSLIKQNHITSTALIVSYNNQTNANQSFEQNEKTVNDIFLKTVAVDNYTFTGAQITALYNIANQCPNIGGTSVFKARGLYQAYDCNAVFDDNELCYGIIREASNLPDSSKKGDRVGIVIYPNPASNTIFVKFDKEISSETNIEVINSIGEKVIPSITLSSGNEKEIDVSALPTGIYFVRVTEGNSFFFSKFTVQK